MVPLPEEVSHVRGDGVDHLLLFHARRVRQHVIVIVPQVGDAQLVQPRENARFDERFIVFAPWTNCASSYPVTRWTRANPRYGGDYTIWARSARDSGVSGRANSSIIVKWS